MDFLKNITSAFIGGRGNLNPLKLPQPRNYGTLIYGSTQDILKQYISMEDKTIQMFEYASSKESFSDHCLALMRYSAYSAVAVYGVNLSLLSNELEIEKNFSNDWDQLLYGNILYDIANFSWFMLMRFTENNNLSKNFEQEKLLQFLNNDSTPKVYWKLVYNFMFGPKNAERAYERLEGIIGILEMTDPDRLDNAYIIESQQKFDDMLRLGVVGDPNKWRMFDHVSIMKTTIMGPREIEKKRQDILSASICQSLEPELRLHFGIL